MRVLGWCHNGYHMLPAAEIARRARIAGLDGLIIKYGDPAFERAITAEGIRWGVERFAYAHQAAREGDMLADAIDAGAAFAVANCEPNDGGGWERADASPAIRTLIDTFRRRHPGAPLWICADLRRGRSLDAPFIREAANGGVQGWMPMVYPKAFGQSVAAAFDAGFPGATYLGLPCAPVLQAYDGIGAGVLLEQVFEAGRRGAAEASMYVVETASERELQALAWATAGRRANALRDTALAYLRGAIALLDHGSAAALRDWAARFASDHG